MANGPNHSPLLSNAVPPVLLYSTTVGVLRLTLLYSTYTLHLLSTSYPLLLLSNPPLNPPSHLLPKQVAIPSYIPAGRFASSYNRCTGPKMRFCYPRIRNTVDYPSSHPAD